MEKRKWTPQETEALYKFLRQGKGANEIAQTLGRSKKAVRIKVEKLGLSFSDFRVADFNAKCPFFKTVVPEGGICCEGVNQSSVTICLFFDVLKQREHFLSKCADSYSSCPLAEALIEKYERSTPSV